MRSFKLLLMAALLTVSVNALASGPQTYSCAFLKQFCMFGASLPCIDFGGVDRTEELEVIRQYETFCSPEALRAKRIASVTAIVNTLLLD